MTAYTPDMARVDMLAVEFACNGTRMKLNPDERIVAVQGMLGKLPQSEIAWRIHTYRAEVRRIARETPGTALCPFCQQIAYQSQDGVVAQHVDHHGYQWCPQSGHHRDDRKTGIYALSRT